MWKLALFSASLLSICTQTFANENVVNGGFSSGAIAPWTTYAGTAVVSRADNSPFTNIYASDGKCMQINKSSGTKGFNGCIDLGGLGADTVTVNYDFNLQTVGIWMEVLAVQGRGIGNICIFIMDTSSNQFHLVDGSGDSDLITLEANTWYNVQATFNTINWTYSGSITRYGGSTVTWTNRALMGNSYGAIGGLLLDEWNPSAASNVIKYDNFSVQTPNLTKHAAMRHSGVPFFPIGIYGSPTPTDQTVSLYACNNSNAMELAAAGFNNYFSSIADLTRSILDDAFQWGLTITADCNLPPHEYMKYTTEFVVGSSLDTKIQEVRIKKALLAYYGIDEPLGKAIVCEQTFDWLTPLLKGRDFVELRDPYHPVIINECSYPYAIGYSKTLDGVTYTTTNQGYVSYAAGGDIYGMDTYPYDGASSDLTFPEKAVDASLHVTSSAKPVLSVLQGQANGEAVGDHSHPRPDLAATRFMAYSSIIHGTNGIYWWGADWIEPDSQLWKDIKSVARELNDIQDVLASGSESASFTLSNPNLEGVLKTCNGYHYLIVANRSFAAIPSASISVTGFQPANNNGNIVVLFESGSSTPRCRLITASGTSWIDSFKPWGVHVYTDKPTILRRARNDYDGDGRSDIADAYLSADNVFNWNIIKSRCTDSTQTRWGGGSDIPISGDFDGDGKTDYGVFSNGIWNILKSSTGNSSSYSIAWGSAGDTPVVGDFDGDGRSDITVFSGHDWKILKSSSYFTQSITHQMGNQAAGDIPVVGDFDGDGKSDIAVFSGQYWYILKSGTGDTAGIADTGQTIVASITIPNIKSLADMVVVKVSGTVTAIYGGYFYIESSNGVSGIRINMADSCLSVGDNVQVIGKTDSLSGERVIDAVSVAGGTADFSTNMAVKFGDKSAGDIPVVGDFDGDGKDDIVVYNSGVWHVLKSSSNFTTSTTYSLGSTGDVPINGDYDGDGKSDLAVVSSANPRVWRTLGSASNFTKGIRYLLGSGSDYVIGSCCYK